jgi:hypothetical protein
MFSVLSIVKGYLKRDDWDVRREAMEMPIMWVVVAMATVPP